MHTPDHLFFCAIGGSGMMPLALIMKARGAVVSGSDRARDQGRTPARFAFLEKEGIALFPQNGSGVNETVGKMVVSTAVETTVPDYQAALEKKIPIIHRAELLAKIANEAKLSIAVAGTSGKSTTTGMIGWILHQTERNPTIVNGAVMKNFVSPDQPFASAVVGDPDLVVVEADESDGSIENFQPTIAVLNNVAVDHKTLEDLRVLFASFLAKAKLCIVNLDNVESAALAQAVESEKKVTYSLTRKEATLTISGLSLTPDGALFDVIHTPDGRKAQVTLRLPGHHNVSNALAALAAAMAAGAPFEAACASLSCFAGMARRMDVIGQAHGITIIDDFAHNPDKIAATLKALHQFDGRVLILFQPHGYGPLENMKDGFVEAFAKGLKSQDVLFLPEPLYLGGTVRREVTSADLAAALRERKVKAEAMEKREDCAASLIKMAQAGDRIVIMGARDDTLTSLAREILFHIGIRLAN